MKKKLKSDRPLRAATCSPASDTPETDEATLKAIDIDGGGEFDAVHVQVAKRLERERDGARDETIRTHEFMLRGFNVAAAEIAQLRSAIGETIMENLHLADGDVCTLKRLKNAIGFDLDSPENARGMARELAAQDSDNSNDING